MKLYTRFFISNTMISILPIILIHKHDGIRYPFVIIELAWFNFWLNIKFKIK